MKANFDDFCLSNGSQLEIIRHQWVRVRLQSSIDGFLKRFVLVGKFGSFAQFLVVTSPPGKRDECRQDSCQWKGSLKIRLESRVFWHSFFSLATRLFFLARNTHLDSDEVTVFFHNIFLAILLLFLLAIHSYRCVICEIWNSWNFPPLLKIPNGWNGWGVVTCKLAKRVFLSLSLVLSLSCALGHLHFSFYDFDGRRRRRTYVL